MTNELLANVTWWTYLACLVYLLIVAGFFALLVLGGARETRQRGREHRLDDLETLAASPFTIPVTIVAPTYNEEVYVPSTIGSLLTQVYPEYEVIVVNDGSTDGTLAQLQDTFELEPTGAVYRRVLPSREIRQIYRSRRDPRLTVVDKANGGKADALNCGINLARYRYVCCVDGDTVYHPDALLRGMRRANEDPATVVGVTSQIGASARPELAPQDGMRLRVDRNPLTVYQMLDYLRAFLGSRLAWSRWNYMLCSVGAFAIWRRDVLLELGGFSTRFTCEDIEFTFRVHRHFREAKRPYRVLSLPDPVGVTEAPSGVARLVSQRARWQRVIIETVWAHRRMLGNPRYGSVGLAGMPYYLIGEVLAPVFQAVALAAIPVAMAAGLIRWDELVRVLAIVALGNGIFTAAAVLLQERHLRVFSGWGLLYVAALGPLELFLYRPIIFYAQLRGLIDFLRGDRAWHKFQRNRPRRWLQAARATTHLFT